MLAAISLAIMLAADPQVSTDLVCDGNQSASGPRIVLGEGFKRFRADVRVHMAPKGGHVLAFEYAGPKDGAIFAVSVMAPPRTDGSYPPVWSTMIGSPAGHIRGGENAAATAFELELRQDSGGVAYLRLKWRNDDGSVREGGSALAAPLLTEGRFNLSCSGGRFELSNVTVD
jgi:hypothetical protein